VTEPSRVCLVGQPTRDDAFEEFFRAEYPTLCRALVLMAGDALEAQDLAQEALARVYERWDRVAAMDSPGGYLYRVALNLQRKRAMRRARPAAPAPRPGTGADPSEVIQARAELTRVLAALPLGQRQALVLIEWIGLDAAEAAAVLGIKAASVRVRVHRAKTALREQFGEPDE
jgi:RNA polymerase sigma factor (sigma-70 family)